MSFPSLLFRRRRNRLLIWITFCYVKRWSATYLWAEDQNMPPCLMTNVVDLLNVPRSNFTILQFYHSKFIVYKGSLFRWSTIMFDTAKVLQSEFTTLGSDTVKLLQSQSLVRVLHNTKIYLILNFDQRLTTELEWNQSSALQKYWSMTGHFEVRLWYEQCDQKKITKCL